MRPAESDAREQLMASLRQQKCEYQEVMEILATLPSDEELSDPASHESVTRLQDALRQASIAETRLTAAREHYEQLGRPTSPELQQLLADQEALLSQFVAAIDSIQSRFATARDRLQPQVDGSVRRRAMHNAYQRSMRTG